MILESVRIKNWRSLGNVNVQAFSPGITVIHAPNKTGKTSLVEAIRSTLIDLDYDTTRVAPVVPWGTNSVPGVTVGFSVGGERYVLSKRFTKRKEGGAELRKVRADGGRGELVAKDKNVTLKTRDLVGVEKSNRGLAQLLWVSQGVVDLPKMDEELDEALRPVLGSVISGRDMGFRQVLWTRMQQWFTNEQNAGRGRHRKGSRLREIEEKVSERDEEVKEIDAEFGRAESQLSEVERKEQEIAEAEALVEAASREVERLKNADRGLLQKREKAKELENRARAVRQELEELEEARAKREGYEDRAKELAEQLEEAGTQLKPLTQAKKAAAKALSAATDVRQKAEDAFKALSDHRATVDAMRRLVKIDEATGVGEKALRKAEEVEKRVVGTKEKLAGLSAPDKKDASAIEKLLNRLVKVEAELNAAQLSLAVTPSKRGSATVQVDREAEESVALAPGEVLERAVKQRVRVGIAGFGSVEVVRGTEDKSVEDLGSERDGLEAELRRLLAEWGMETVDRSEVVAELSKRLAERESLEDRVKRQQEQLSEEAPEGREALRREIAARRKEKGRLLRAHPELEKWKASPASLEQAEADLKEEEERWGEALADARRGEDAARGRLEETEKRMKSAETSTSEVQTERRGSPTQAQGPSQQFEGAGCEPYRTAPK